MTAARSLMRVGIKCRRLEVAYTSIFFGCAWGPPFQQPLSTLYTPRHPASKARSSQKEDVVFRAVPQPIDNLRQVEQIVALELTSRRPLL